jgi:hypothetical protein
VRPWPPISDWLTPAQVLRPTLQHLLDPPLQQQQAVAEPADRHLPRRAQCADLVLCRLQALAELLLSERPRPPNRSEVTATELRARSGQRGGGRGHCHKPPPVPLRLLARRHLPECFEGGAIDEEQRGIHVRAAPPFVAIIPPD